jgi:carbon monoxide dehydrogenase subunit G
MAGFDVLVTIASLTKVLAAFETLVRLLTGVDSLKRKVHELSLMREADYVRIFSLMSSYKLTK